MSTAPSLARAFLALLRRDLLLALRRKSDLTTVMFFFVVVASLFPLAIGPERATLRLIGGGVVWVAALLASLLALERLFAADHADGTLEQIALAGPPLPLLVLAKVLAHWLYCGLPLVLVAPLLGVQYDLDGKSIGVLALSVLLGTPTISLIGAIGAALTLGLRVSNSLIPLLVLPLLMPILIFGAGAVGAVSAGTSIGGNLSLLSAMLIMSLMLAPWAIAAALESAIE